MPARSKRDRKQQKLSKKKKRELAARKRRKARVANASSLADDKRLWFGDEAAGGPESDTHQPLSPEQRRGVDQILGMSEESASKQPRIPEREETEADIWWGKYSKADGVARLRMTREKLKSVATDDEEYERFFPEAISELEPKLSPKDYVVFLEELREAHPEAFASSADWNTRSMVFEYLAQGRLDDVDRAATYLAGELQDVSDPFFSLMSTLRLAGRAEACRALIDAAVNKLEDSKLMHWAVDEILEWAMFAHYQRCVARDVTDEAVEALHVAARELDIEDDEKSRTNRRDIALHLAGRSGKQWSKEELTSRDNGAFRNIYLLGVDYQRWLCEERGFEAIVADELRGMVIGAINGVDCPFNRLLTGLPRREFDRYLAGKLGFMSLDRMTAPATIIAMKHYYDFLQELELIKPKAGQNSQLTCDNLWKQLKRALGDDQWRTYTFLEEYLPVA